MSDQSPNHGKRTVKRDTFVAGVCGATVALMIGASYAAVPLYDWFCRTTGFAGTTMVATSTPTSGPLERTINVRFDANVSGGLPWKFVPEQNEINVRIGEVVTIFYKVTNSSARETVAQASYNVTPLNVGGFFQKINCFCFTDQTLAPGETREMPVAFYVDQKLADDTEHDGLNTITLSYTFYPVRNPVKPVAAVSTGNRSGNL